MLRARQRLGKYVIQRRLAEGGFAAVYEARDTIEGVRVALKIPHPHLMNEAALESFRQEVRLVAKLDHPNILPLKTADFIDGQFVIVTALGECSLEDRLQKRLALKSSVQYSTQMLAAVAFAHERKIVHCDIKPDNFLLFPNDLLRLADFGIARVANRTLQASGGGTLGYVAPEQAMGKPSLRSDVFSLGIVMYRMFSGQLPDWPYIWPMVGYERLRKRVSPPLLELLRRATAIDAKRRFRDAVQMQATFQRIRQPLLVRNKNKRTTTRSAVAQGWQRVRWQEFQRRHGKTLSSRFECAACHGPVAEAMGACPWCGEARKRHQDATDFPLQCPRCWRGLKLDWPYCPWCYGAGFECDSQRKYSDGRYVARCHNAKCTRKLLMPFMRYCPWCHRRVRRKWTFEGASSRCGQCGWGVLPEYWSYCPWCEARIDISR